MMKECFIQETVYTAWLAVLNEIWKRLTKKYLVHQKNLAETHERSGKKFNKKDLILLQWLEQNN